MKAPSTEWREKVGADEETRFKEYSEQLVEIQKRNHAKSGGGRALHRKQHLGLAAKLEVLPDLPEYARHGLFAKPGPHDAQLRLSNGGPERTGDKRPDIRGLAIRVGGVDGPGALGSPATAQCFVLINNATFAFPTVDEFMGIVRAASKSPLAVLGRLIKTHGFFAGLKRASQLGKTLGKPFAGYANETFHTAAPIACGPYAAKVRLVPHNGAAAVGKITDFAAEVTERLGKGDLHWDLQLQFFVDEKTTPIEDPTVLWPESEAPFVTVAKLIAPKQDPHGAEGKKVADAIEAGKFDPWAALADHRPLGEIMRARKSAYFASQQERGAA